MITYPARGERMTRVRMGRHTAVTASPLGFAISNATGSNAFLHPFTPSATALTVQFSLGTIAGKVPTIGGQPIGGPGVIPPVLTLDPALVTKDGESWACLEVVPDPASGQLVGDFKREIVQRNEPVSLDPALGRCPLALFYFVNRAVALTVPIVFFNLQYSRYLPPAGQGSVQHFFL
jgi:hypothetical protein